MLRVIFTVSIITLFSCKSQQNNAEPMSELEKEMTISLVMSDSYGGTEEPEIQVFRKEAELKAFFAKINRTRKPGLEVPEIDFTAEMAVVYCTGKTTDPALPALYPVDNLDDKLIIAPKSTPTTNSTAGSATLLPFGLYKMPLTEKPVVLDKQ